MSEQRTRRTKEARVADIEKTIAYHKMHINSLEEKKARILNPSVRTRKITIKSLLEQAKEKGLDEKEIAKRLGLSE